jgi:hypothetical protein
MAHLTAPVYSIFAWSFILLLIKSLWFLLRDTTSHVHQLHQIPCSHCRFFTDNHQLKCTVHPTIAMTESATDCSDYCPSRSPVEEYTAHYPIP